MSPEQMEKAFVILDETVTLLQDALDISFLEAYTENTENLIDDYQVRIVEGQPNREITAKLEKKYQELKSLNLSSEDWRKASQIVLLKGNRSEPLQANHQLTPDSIGFLFVFLIEQLYPEKKLRILDLASGMGNLLLTVVLNLELAGYSVQGYGVDIDETLLSVAAANTEFAKANIHYFHQDGLQELLVEPADVVLADLPIGYYPNDEKAKDFMTGAKESHSYAHHLLMEQGMKYAQPAGFGLFLLPSNFLESEQSSEIKKWLNSEVYLQGIIQLPEEIFQSASSRKSIVILQSKDGNARQAKEVLVMNLGSLKNASTMTEFLSKFEDWKSLNL